MISSPFDNLPMPSPDRRETLNHSHEDLRSRLWHGGVPGLRRGDVLTGGQSRRVHEGCPFCEAREAGGAVTIDGVGIDGPSFRPDRAYVTADREYARFHASLWGRGDLYRVEPIDPDDLEPSTEDHFPSS